MSSQLRGLASRIRTVAVIDVGTASIRMAIAEIQPDGNIRTLESLSQAVHLGADTFANGEISRQTIEACVSVLRSYRRKLDEYRITRTEDIRIVATSAVRESLNRITFIDRIFVATGLNIETLDEAEVHRIIYRGVQPLLKEQAELFRADAMIVEVGGGNTEMLSIFEGNVSDTHALRLGSLRLQQLLSTFKVPRNQSRQVVEGEIHGHLEPFHELISSHNGANMVSMGGDIRFAVREILNESFQEDKLVPLPVSKLSRLIDYIFGKSEDHLVNKFHLTYHEAETLGPALLINLKIAELLGVDQILATNINLRDGLIRDLFEGGAWSADFRKQIIRATWELANRYDVDEDHCRNVADLCRLLFEQLRKEHGLEDRYETLLYVAAALHESGAYINTSSLHKHSMYLIMNSSLFGLTADDLQIVGLIARYHRRSIPKTTHQPYASMDRNRRVAVSKLAAILRVALALDASRNQRIREIECSRVRNRIVISVTSNEDLSIEKIALRRNQSFFESIFGLEVLLRTQIKQSLSERTML